MDSKSILLKDPAALQDGSPDATATDHQVEPLISFDFVSGADFDFASTDESSQDTAEANLMALSEGNGVEEGLSAAGPNGIPEHDETLEQSFVTEEDGLLEQSDVPDRMDTSHQDQIPDQMNISDPKRGLLSPDPSLPSGLDSRRIEVVIPGISAQQRAEYSTVESQVVETILEEKALKTGDIIFRVMFTDGREDEVSLLLLDCRVRFLAKRFASASVIYPSSGLQTVFS